MAWMVLMWVSCDKLPTGTCGPEECAEACAALTPPPPPTPSGQPAPTEFEQKVLDAQLDEIRRGIQPWSDTAIGLCRGRRDCDKFLGVNAGKLGRGAHFVKAELRVPPGPPGTWTVRFVTECTTATGEVRAFERDYDVVNNGGERPTSLNLRAIDSPSEDGAEVCKWTLTTLDPRGDKQYTGTWEVSGK